MTEYDIWKIVGAGRQNSRFYESKKSFESSGRKTINTYKQYGNIKAYRFTSEGWILIEEWKNNERIYSYRSATSSS